MLVSGLHAFGGAVGLQYPALFIVDEVGDEHLIKYLVADGRIVDRDHIFYAAVEVARPPVCAADIELSAAVRQRRAVGARSDAAMFADPAHDRFHADTFGMP